MRRHSNYFVYGILFILLGIIIMIGATMVLNSLDTGNLWYHHMITICSISILFILIGVFMILNAIKKLKK